ncbi:MAG: DUF2007-related protein [Bacteroidetes bacterium]|nr:DUF2007-related protein [Bacteroidota bacterium]
MKTKDEIFPVEVYSGSIWEAELVKSLMENAEIETFLLDENTGTLAPWYTAGGGAGSVKVVVSSLDLDQAKLIIGQYEKNIHSDL